MGQRSLTFLNKSGLFLYWDNIWDDNVNYKRFLKYSYFLNKFFYLFFFDNIFYKVYFSKNKILEKNSLLFTKNLTTHSFYGFESFFYFGKLWFLKYNNWCIFIINIFNSNYTKKDKKKNFFFKKKKLSFFKILSINYLHFLNKSSYDFFLKKYLFL